MFLGTATLAGCDCESMLAMKRKDGAPTSSVGPAASDEAAPAPLPTAVRTRPTARAEKPIEPPTAVVKPSATLKFDPTRSNRNRPRAKMLRPLKLPRNIMPMQRFDGDPVEPPEAQKRFEIESAR